MGSEPGGVYVLLADGATALIRPAVADDFDAVKAMHEEMSSASAYLRFFTLSRTAPEREARRLCREPDEEHAALLALADGKVAGAASYEVSGDRTAEIAFAVADDMHRRGIATLLLEHLVSIARARRLTTFTADTLGENTAMLRVFSDAGLPVRTRREEETVRVTIPLPADDERYLDTVAHRERDASVKSLAPVFDPETVAVVGAGRRPGTVGRSVLENIRSGGFEGTLYAVNRHARHIGGVPAFPSVADLPSAPDLAIIAVPPTEVLDAAQACGERGVRGLVVVTSGLDQAASADLLASCRRHGMRLIGPNCFGIAVPATGLNATFAADPPLPGTAGLVMKSGGLGFSMIDHLSRLGIGISSFASVGDKLDVSSNDLLMWWERDGVTRVAVLYIESFGNPRKFARSARRIGRRMPVLTVASPSGATGAALFEQAGVIATPSFGELVEATALLATQPTPAGRTVAIVANVDGAGLLAAKACSARGLTVHRPRGATRRRLRSLLPEGGIPDGPVETTAPVSRGTYRDVLSLLAADEDVDAIIAIMLPTAATGDLPAALAAATVDVPLAAVVLNQPESVRLLDVAPGRVPAYAYPEAAVAALARAARYGSWRALDPGATPVFPDADTDGARAVIRSALTSFPPNGGCLLPRSAASVLRGYGIDVASSSGSSAGSAAGEAFVSVTEDPTFGPLVTFGGPGDPVTRLAPLTPADADAMTGPSASAGLRDLLLRVSRLADDLPEITELELRPVLADAVVGGARVRVAPQAPQDPFLRRLRLL